MSQPNIALVMPTHNRLEYTKLTLQRLLADPDEQFDLYLWDNASTDQTPDYLHSLKDPRIKEVYISTDNQGQTGAMNYFWSKAKTELVGKVDNDCLMTPGWTRILTKAHKDIHNLGAVAAWHFFEDDFDENKVRSAGKIASYNGHQIFRHPWVCGSGFIMKKRTYTEIGPWKKGSKVGTTYYFMKMAQNGCINGFYYPLVYQEHMDDPKSQYCVIKDEQSYQKYKNITFGLKSGRYNDIHGRMKSRQQIVNNLLVEPADPGYYTGLRAKTRRLKSKIKKIFS